VQNKLQHFLDSCIHGSAATELVMPAARHWCYNFVNHYYLHMYVLTSAKESRASMVATCRPAATALCYCYSRVSVHLQWQQIHCEAWCLLQQESKASLQQQARSFMFMDLLATCSMTLPECPTLAYSTTLHSCDVNDWQSAYDCCSEHGVHVHRYSGCA
jgi:hypothetical protein